MGGKLGCKEPGVLLLLIISALFFPLRDSFQTGHTTAGASPHFQQVAQQPEASLNRCQQQRLSTRRGTASPTRRLSRMLRPSKDSEKEQDIATGEVEGAVGEDDGLDCTAKPEKAAAEDQAVITAMEGNGVEDEVDLAEAHAAAPAAAATTTAVVDAVMEVASFEFAPPMTIHKFLTMQDRRVPVSIKYSGGGGFKRYFEEIAMLLKRHFPDVTIVREIVEVSSMREEEVFEIRIDGKLVCAKRRGKPGVYLNMEMVGQAIRKARQRRRPGSIVYGDEETYRNVKALADQRTADDSLERGFKDFAAADEDTPPRV